MDDSCDLFVLYEQYPNGGKIWLMLGLEETTGSDYDDILDMLDKYYAENPSLDPIAIINEEIKNMNDPQTEEKINEEENEIISYMSSLDLFKTVTGDSNIDGNVDMSDVVLIMQSLSNPNKYKLTPQGRKNADHDDNGVTNADALAVQMGLLGL